VRTDLRELRHRRQGDAPFDCNPCEGRELICPLAQPRELHWVDFEGVFDAVPAHSKETARGEGTAATAQFSNSGWRI
jgi:hypothetical protein